MRLFLIRHAHAQPHATDAKRPLSDRGVQTTRRLVQYFRANATFTAGQLWHSPLKRAQETALILANAMGEGAPIVETDGLCHDDDPALMAARLTAYPTTQDLALVGHEPHLSSLATLLVRGQSNPSAFHLKKSAIIMLRRTEKTHRRTGYTRWRVAWHFSPELLPPE